MVEEAKKRLETTKLIYEERERGVQKLYISKQ